MRNVENISAQLKRAATEFMQLDDSRDIRAQPQNPFDGAQSIVSAGMCIKRYEMDTRGLSFAHDGKEMIAAALVIMRHPG
jgi:hypothetical protein